ncbi:hypothetical protein ES703_69792 [subsurface metagenome]
MAIARDVWTGTVPNTPKQVTQQGNLSAVALAWGVQLSPGQRETWYDRAKTVVWRDRMGEQYIPTGYQLFMKWNIRRKVMGLSILTDAPITQAWVYIEELELLANVPMSYIQMTLWKTVSQAAESYGVEFYKAGPFDSGGRRPIAGEWLFLARKVPPSTNYDYDVVFGKWYWYRGRAIAEFGDVQNWFQEQVHYT